MTALRHLNPIRAAAAALKRRKDEVNRLNVFPVPDGDTGTNMSLTMDAVLGEVEKLPADADLVDVCHAVTHGSLLGARGNSGVILSQILRGLCEGIGASQPFDAETIAAALERSQIVAFQAVRKPVEGTILTVLRDTAQAARALADSGTPLEETLDRCAAAAFESVKRTPELLPVLRENNVVDAGGFGLAILADGFTASVLGRAVEEASPQMGLGELKVVPIDDWDDTEYLYCTEFLLFGESIDIQAVRDFVSSMGGSELVVGSDGEYKVHVHTDDPGAVLEHMTQVGEVADVHIHNMRRQADERDALIVAAGRPAKPADLKPLGFVAVAAGDGLAEILRSLGVDVVVHGGQTMNPSTADLAAAIDSVAAEHVIVLPNNRNIVLAANAAVTVAKTPATVVPTTSVPAAFSAMLAWDGSSDAAATAAAMEAAAAAVRTGEVTTAVKDAHSKAGAIRSGQVIGIIDHEIEVVGTNAVEVAERVADTLLAGGASTLTLLSGEGLSAGESEALAGAIRSAHPEVELETHAGGQPLYPVIMSAE